MSREKKLIIEPKVVVKPDLDLPAFSVVDAGSRYEALAALLNPDELNQLIEIDEKESITANIAEMTGIGVMPYSLTMINNDIGSAKILEDRYGNKKFVFRSMINMLESCVEKQSDNRRAQTTLRQYRDIISPLLKDQQEGNVVAFFSPPDWGGRHEYDYGFIYLVQKNGFSSSFQDYDGLAFKVDFSKEEYLQVYEKMHKMRGNLELGSNTFEAETVNAVFAFDKTNETTMIQVLGQILCAAGREVKGGYKILGKLINSLPNYVNQTLDEYDKIKVSINNKAKKYINALQENDIALAEKELSKIQQKTLSITNPELLRRAIIEAERDGMARISLPCGFMYLFGSRLDSLNLALMGIVDPENDIWICEGCGHPHHIDAKNGVLRDVCENCGRSGRC